MSNFDMNRDTFESPTENTIKIVLLGESEVGKTSLLSTYLGRDFDPDQKSTVGSNNIYKTVYSGDRKVRVELLDFGGRRDYRTLNKSKYKNVDGFIAVFDLTNPSSYEEVTSRWIKEIESAEQYSTKKIVKVLVGNKFDLSDSLIECEQIQKDSKILEMKYFECSAKTRHNVDKMFKFIIDACVENMTRVSNKRPTMRSQSTDHGLDASTYEEPERYSFFCCCFCCCRNKDGGQFEYGQI